MQWAKKKNKRDHDIKQAHTVVVPSNSFFILLGYFYTVM